MQRYLDRILECTFDPTQSLKIIALDVLGNIIQQGLAHPVLVCEFVPIIVHYKVSITYFIYMYFLVYPNNCCDRDQSRTNCSRQSI
jgi:hypothetical protein